MINLLFVLFSSLPQNISVYFQEDTLSKRLARFVAGAQSSLDICFHQYYDYEVIDSTLNAWNRGVKIRVITEHKYINYSGTQELIDAGIPVIDEGYGANTSTHRMHNKFIIRDYRDADTTNDAVWVGSFNASGTWMADNAVSINSFAMSEIFEAEFNQMWGDTDDTPNPAYSRTGSNKYDQCPFHEVYVSNIKFEVYFSPYNRISNTVLDEINYATSEINFLMFTFTNYDIYSAMGIKFSQGTVVYGVLEGQQDYNRDAYDYFQAHSIPVVWDNFNSGHGTYLHDKYMVVDDSLVLTGSYNFTEAADTSNDESIIVIYSTDIASLYKNEFIKRYEETGHIYDIHEKQMPSLPRYNKKTILISQKNFRKYFAKTKGLAVRLNGQIINNPLYSKGVIFCKPEDAIKWQRILITK